MRGRGLQQPDRLRCAVRSPPRRRRRTRPDQAPPPSGRSGGRGHAQARIAAQREADLRQAFSRAGVDTLELSTSDDLVHAVMRFAELRKRRSRLSGAANLPAHLRSA